MTVSSSPAPPGSAPLERRRRDLETLARERWELLVVGGGIVGCGILLDAASRGLRAALVEQDDIAVGTSSRSSRLIHGGLRYLEQFQVGLVREALAERARLLRLAPHLVHLETQLFPVYGVPAAHRAFYGSGLAFYDLLGARREGGRARHLGVEGTLELAPQLRRQGLRGGIVYHDGVEDDARYTLAVLRTAIRLGALALTRARATGPLIERGQVVGLRVHDIVGESDLEVRSNRVIDATGVWAARPDNPFGPPSVRLRPSRGTHLVVPRARIPVASGMTIRIPHKVLFLVPWPGYWLIGATDDPDDGPAERPRATAADVEALLRLVNETLDVDLVRADLVGTFAGLRPLVGDPGGGSTVAVSREHRVWREPSGLVRIGGGKYTTYRIMAQDAVDVALGPEAERRPSATAELALVGAAPRTQLGRLAVELETKRGLPSALARRLVARHGSEAPAILAAGDARALGPDVEQLEAEVGWAVREELALSLDDVLARRLRLAMELPDRGAAIAPRVAQLMAAELGWDERRRAAEVERYLATAHREYDVPA
jgi:glycerol-3-phosphate dehydrogenase